MLYKQTAVFFVVFLKESCLVIKKNFCLQLKALLTLKVEKY